MNARMRLQENNWHHKTHHGRIGGHHFDRIAADGLLLCVVEFCCRCYECDDSHTSNNQGLSVERVAIGA